MQKYNAFRNQTLSMSNTKYPQFKSRKLSRSLSKQKYAPYTKKQNNVKFFQNPKENKLNLQPLDSHLQNQSQQTFLPRKFKLKIENMQERRLSTEASTNIVSRNRRWIQIEQINSYNQIMKKIQQQTSIIKKSLEQMTSNIVFPRGNAFDQSLKKYQQFNQRQFQSYKRQQKIIQNLQQLTLNSSEIFILRNINSNYQKQIDKNQQEIKKLKNKYQQLNIQYQHWKLSIEQLKKQTIESSSQTDDKQKIQVSKPYQNIFQTFKQPYELKFDSNGKLDQNFCSTLLKKIQESDLQNQILKENIKILNYSLQEKQQEIHLLKIKIDALNTIGRYKTTNNQQRQHLQFNPKISIEKIQITNQISIPFIDNELVEQNSTKIFEKISKKDNTEVTPIQSKNVENQEKTNTQQINFNYFSSSLMDRHRNFEESKISPFYSNLYKNKSNLNKSFYKNKKRSSFMSVEQKQKLKKQKIQNEYKTNETLEILKLIRKTISYRLKGLKTTYEHFQIQILQNYPHFVKKQEIRQILRSNIFGMSQIYTSIIIKYIFKEKEIEKQSNQIQNYVFCLKMRQFISQYTILDDQQEEIVVQNIKKLLFCNFSMIKRQMQNFEHQQGIIKINFFIKVLEAYKFNERQIDLIVSQCCIISSDINSLQYTRYLRIFQNVQ